jgi:hypothetical protein
LPPAIKYDKSLKNYLILFPVFADSYIYVNPNYFIFEEAIEFSTALSTYKSDLLPIISIVAY